MTPIKLIIADDHELILQGLVSIFEDVENIEVIAEANNGQELLRYIDALNPDVVFIDLDMPIMDGFASLKAIEEKQYPCKKIMLTMHQEKSLITKAIELGADGYLLKTALPQEIVDAVNRVFSGQKAFSSDVTLSLLNGDSNSRNSDESKILTERELEIVALIAKGKSNKEIADELFISHRTVDTHRSNLMKKLEINNVAKLIRWAIDNDLA